MPTPRPRPRRGPGRPRRALIRGHPGPPPPRPRRRGTPSRPGPTRITVAWPAHKFPRAARGLKAGARRPPRRAAAPPRRGPPHPLRSRARPRLARLIRTGQDFHRVHVPTRPRPPAAPRRCTSPGRRRRRTTPYCASQLLRSGWSQVVGHSRSITYTNSRSLVLKRARHILRKSEFSLKSSQKRYPCVLRRSRGASRWDREGSIPIHFYGYRNCIHTSQP